jgi:transcriptional regulator with XRE-family HTH domain
VPYHPRAAEQAVTGDQIREARKRLGWTQAELAKKVGLSRPFIALVEQGRRILATQDLDRVRQELGI